MRNPRGSPGARPRPSPRPAEAAHIGDDQEQATVSQQPTDAQEQLLAQPDSAATAESSPAAAGWSLGGMRPFPAFTIFGSMLAVVLISAAAFFGLQYFEAQKVLANKALVDEEATVDVKREMTAAVETLFSYDYKNIRKTEQAANGILANDKVRGIYNALLSEVKRDAPDQKLIVSSQVSRIAVIELNDDTARLLVFVNQSATRKDNNDPNIDGGQLTVTAERLDGKWMVSHLNAYEKQDE